MKNMLVVVDMVNGFINFGALADKKINDITPNIIKLIEKAKSENFLIVAFKDCHSENDKEFEIFPPHCLKGSEESELIPELKGYEKDMIMIEKDTTNGFATDEFKKIIKETEFDNVYVCGCCTDICVVGFVESFLKYIKNNNRKTKIHVIDNACYTFNGEGHDAKECHNTSIDSMKKQGASIKRV
jgi:nicotinamidase-related amidase